MVWIWVCFCFFFIADFTGHRMQLENASLRLIVCSKVTVLVFILVSFWVVLVWCLKFQLKFFEVLHGGYSSCSFWTALILFCILFVFFWLGLHLFCFDILHRLFWLGCFFYYCFVRLTTESEFCGFVWGQLKKGLFQSNCFDFCFGFLSVFVFLLVLVSWLYWKWHATQRFQRLFKGSLQIKVSNCLNPVTKGRSSAL